MGPKCCPTIHSTGINPQLVVTVRYKALTVLQFWIFSAFFASPKSKRQRVFLNFGVRYAHQSFGTCVYFGGGYESVTTFWLGFRNRWPDPSSETVRFCAKMIKFSAFFHFSQHWMGVFTRGFRHHAVFLIQKQKLRARGIPGLENTECARCFNDVLWHSWNWPKIRVFRPVLTMKTLQTLLNPIFGTVECAPN